MSNLLSSVVVRSVVPSDAAVWEAIRRELWPDGSEDHVPEIAMYFAGKLQEPAAVLVAERFAGWIVGFAELSIRVDIACFEGKRIGCVRTECDSGGPSSGRCPGIAAGVEGLGAAARMRRVRERSRRPGRRRQKLRACD